MKRGAADISHRVIIFIFELLIVIIVTLAIFYVVNSFTNKKLDVSQLESNILLLRPVYSPNCFAYEDVKVYPGIIDLSKFKSERFSQCLNGNYYFKASLLNNKKEVYVNETEFKINQPFCKFKDKYVCSSRNQYVIVKDKDLITKDILKIEAILKK